MAIRALLAAALIFGAALPAHADPVSDYSFWRTAGTLDDACHYLKFVERIMLGEVASDTIAKTGQYAHLLDGRMTQPDYNAWADGLEATADATAASIGCTDAAMPYLNAVRAKASELLYQNLLLAFHFASLPADDTNRAPLGPDEVAAAQRYDLFLQQVFGANFQTFAANQRALAGQRLPPSAAAGGVDEFGLPIIDYSLGIYNEAEFKLLWDAQADARRAVQIVHFEVAAETAGLQVWRRKAQKYNEVSTLHVAGSGELVGTVFDGPSVYRLDSGEEIFGVFLYRPDGTLRLMTYGTNATDKLTPQGVARLLVRSEEPPAGTSDYAIFDLPDFRTLAFPFDGIPVTESCLGGPCWDFSAETLEALYQTAPSEYAELWLSADPEAAPKAVVEAASYLRGRVSPFLLWPINDKSRPDAKTD